jgi:N-acetylglucosaminyldiphosphoundecaprenol N-acetyl-beta-D-mannosaminyltransferase
MICMIKILGIKLSHIKKEDFLMNLDKALDKDTKIFICTPNPEIILKSHQDEELFYILNQADYCLADGFGLQIAGKLSQQNFPRITGADISLDLLKLAEKKAKKVIIINHEKGLSTINDLKKALNKFSPDLNFLIINSIPKIHLDRDKEKIIHDFSPDILFCLFGCPWQEKFIYHNLDKFKTLKIAIGVGGAFDFITKKAKRAPVFLRKLGLEWFWRLILEPKRFKRILMATFVFMKKVIIWRYILPLKYRRNVACLLYKYENNERKILIVKRSDTNNHWQIPQGGLDGQNIIEAGKRELREEIGTSNFTLEKAYKNIFKYKFINNFKSLDEKNKHYDKFGYKGQKQSLIIARFSGSNEEIKINFWDHLDFKWVKEDDFIDSVHDVRKKSAKIFLKKFKQLKYEKN